jgi:hypothetical protein
LSRHKGKIAAFIFFNEQVWEKLSMYIKS